MHAEYSDIGGISKKYREYLDILNREFHAPFTTEEAVEVLGLDKTKGRRTLAHLVSNGWLSRISKGIYNTVPLGSLDPKSQSGNAWIVANKLFAPCYIGGWSAAEHWHLTEQIFNDVFVVTAKNIRRTKQSVKNIRYKLKSVKKNKLFGTSNAWIGGVKVLVSDPSKTLVDMLDDPSLGGGIRHVADILTNYFESDHKDTTLLNKYIKKMNNNTIYKRLGFLLEALEINEKAFIEICKKNISAGYSDLDPAIVSEGKITNRWNLKINVKLDKGVE